jgi:hypothetical protein
MITAIHRLQGGGGFGIVNREALDENPQLLPQNNRTVVPAKAGTQGCRTALVALDARFPRA